MRIHTRPRHKYSQSINLSEASGNGRDLSPSSHRRTSRCLCFLMLMVLLSMKRGDSCFNLGVEQMANASLSRNFTHWISVKRKYASLLIYHQGSRLPVSHTSNKEKEWENQFSSASLLKTFKVWGWIVKLSFFSEKKQNLLAMYIFLDWQLLYPEQITINTGQSTFES